MARTTRGSGYRHAPWRGGRPERVPRPGIVGTKGLGWQLGTWGCLHLLVVPPALFLLLLSALRYLQAPSRSTRSPRAAVRCASAKRGVEPLVPSASPFRAASSFDEVPTQDCPPLV